MNNISIFCGIIDRIVEGTDGKLYYVRSNGYLHEIFSLEFQSRRIERAANLLINHDYVGVDGRNGYFMLQGTYNDGPVFIIEVPGYRLTRIDGNVVDYNIEKQCALCVDGKHCIIVNNVRRYIDGRFMQFNADRCIYTTVDNNAVLIVDALTNEVKRVLPGSLADHEAVIYPVSERYFVRLLPDTVDLLVDDILVDRIPLQNVKYSSMVSSVHSIGDSCIVRCYNDKSLYIDFSREPPITVFSMCDIYRLTKKGILCLCGYLHTVFIGIEELRRMDRKYLLNTVVDYVRFPVYRSIVYTPSEISP